MKLTHRKAGIIDSFNIYLRIMYGVICKYSHTGMRAHPALTLGDLRSSAGVILWIVSKNVPPGKSISNTI